MSLPKDTTTRILATTHGEQAYKVCETLLDAGFEAWWVGGCVRDMYLGLIPDDIDIATNAKPEEVTSLFPKSDDTAAKLGAIVVSLSGHTFEVTTYREEHELSDGRFPESVAFTDRESDAKRRDITINALYFNPISSELYDPFEGLMDLNERLIRFIGDPEARIAHDALRLLRVIRFRAQINGQYHPDTFSALHAKAKEVSVLSGTRVFRELEKILLGPHPEVAFEDLWETDIIEGLLPELHACKGVAQPYELHPEGDVWNHTLKLIGAFTEDHETDVRWAGLFHDIGKPPTFSIDDDRIRFNEHASVGADVSKNIFERLQVSKKRTDKICWLISHHMMMGTFSQIDDKKKMTWYYHPWFTELLQLFWLDIAGTGNSSFEFYESIIADYNSFLDANPLPKKPLVNGDTVMEVLDLPPGEVVGKVLKELHNAQQDGAISTQKEAIAFLENYQL